VCPVECGILNCRATCLVDFLGLWTKAAPNSFTLPLVTGRSPRLFPLYKNISFTEQLIPLANGRFHSCCPTKIPKKSPLHLDHRHPFVLPEHRPFCIWDCIFYKSVLEPLVARLGSPTSGISYIDHITYLICLVSFFVLLISWAILR